MANIYRHIKHSIVLNGGVTFYKSNCCNDKDRSLLLIFKQGIVDPCNVLSSLGSLNKIVVNGEELGVITTQAESQLSSCKTIMVQFLVLAYNDFERLSTPSLGNSIVAHSHLPANFSKLSELRLSNNIHLHIDDLHWLSQLSSLKSLDLSRTHLPMDTNKDCYGLYLRQCNLRGSIPDFSGHRDLNALDLSNNKLKGSLPDWLDQLDDLQGLNLSTNLFHGSFPSNFGNLSTSSYLDVSFNDLSGTLPKSLEQTSFFLLDLSHNSFSGDISKLRSTGYYVSMSFNKFQGQFPRISGNAIVLDLAYNSFSGSLSSLLLCYTENDTNLLNYLDISNNSPTGKLPDCWSNWARLSKIYLGINMFFGCSSSNNGFIISSAKSTIFA
ncbi:receptor-like protein 14 [Prosopis cineraria]|uniref:receptor-like protein 14 n=1 Tax=Prosopis cineraria TaxID=364024 RepID=UPI00240F7D04|nr:receptor-like protein 14 [Prosopis cineraria]